MNARQYLSSLKSIYRELRQLQRMKQEELDAVTKMEHDLTGMPGAPSKDPHKYESYIILCEKYDEKITELNHFKTEVLEAIYACPDSRHRRILMLRYVPDTRGRTMTFERIAVELGYSYRQTLRLHADALYVFEKNMARHVISNRGNMKS